MSITSCYRYVLELPVNTLNALLKAALSESDGAGISISQHYENVVIGSWTATVDVRPDDLGANPPVVELPPTDLAVRLVQLKMRVETRINQLPELDAIVHQVTFNLDGVFAKTADAPPQLVMQFPAATAATLNLVVSGGQVPLTPELIEPEIHALYDSDPTLGHNVTPGVPWPLGGTVTVVTDIYDDEPSSPGFRGAITIEIPDATHVVIVMPGHFQVLSLNQTYIDTNMTVRILVAVQFNDGEVRFRLSAVQAADVTVTFATSTIYDVGAKPILADQIAAKIRAFGDQVQETPTNAQIADLISTRLIEFASNLEIPVITPAAPSGGDVIDLTTFVPMTVNQQVLALGLEPLGDGTPCDPPDVFAKADGFSISVAASKVQGYIDALKAAINGTTREFEGHDVTVDNVDAALADPGEHSQSDGHIWITGKATAEVDCWEDPEVEFWGPIDLVPSLDPDGTIKVRPDAGSFGADDPCCGDVDPAQIASVIEAEEQRVATMPTNFTKVGQLVMTLTEVDISRAGIVIHGTMDVLTVRAMNVGKTRRAAYWAMEPAGSR
jgi:hypothetical protein